MYEDYCEIKFVGLLVTQIPGYYFTSALTVIKKKAGPLIYSRGSYNIRVNDRFTRFNYRVMRVFVRFDDRIIRVYQVIKFHDRFIKLLCLWGGVGWGDGGGIIFLFARVLRFIDLFPTLIASVHSHSHRMSALQLSTQAHLAQIQPQSRCG